MDRFALSIVAVLTGVLWANRGSAEDAWTPTRYAIKEAFNPAFAGLFLPMRVGDKDVFGIVDTGCGVTIVDSFLKPQLGERLSAVDVQTIGSTVRGDLYKRREMTISDVKATPEVVCALDLGSVRETTGLPIGAVIGMDFLKRYALYADIDARELFLCEAVTNTTSLGEKVPFAFQDSIPKITLTVGAGRTLNATLDTGSRMAVNIGEKNGNELASNGAVRLFKTPTTVTGADGVPRLCRNGQGDLQIASLKLKNVNLIASDPPSIGMRTLNRFRWVADFPGKTLYILPGKHLNADDHADDYGMMIWPSAHGVSVIQVEPKGDASRCGLKEGDVIEWIGDEDVRKHNRAQMLAMLRMFRDKPLPLRVKRGDQQVALDLP